VIDRIEEAAAHDDQPTWAADDPLPPGFVPSESETQGEKIAWGQRLKVLLYTLLVAGGGYFLGTFIITSATTDTPTFITPTKAGQSLRWWRDREWSVMLRSRGNLEFEQGREEKGIDTYELLLRFQPKDVDVLNTLA